MESRTAEARKDMPPEEGKGIRRDRGSAGKVEGDPLGGFSSEELLNLLKQMLLFRRFEEKAEEGYAIGKIGGFCHLHIGQEGAAAGCIGPLREDDYVISAYREHTQALARGIEPKAVMAELYGRDAGSSRGRGGSMHIFGLEEKFMGGHGIVGGQIPLATGMGWAARYRGEDWITLCFLGDAAVNQGAFHESLNMAAIWNLPVIYVVENNGYGMGTAFSRISATEIEDRSGAYAIPASVVDGQDVLATYRHFEQLAKEVREGGGPRFVEVRTYRFRGHSMSDPVSGTYRSREEVEERTEEADPINILRDRLMEAEILDQEALEAMDKEVREVVKEAADFADQAPAPEAGDLYNYVYAQVNEHGRLFLDGRDRT